MPIPLVALAAGAAAIPQLVKGVSGIFQSAKGRRLEKNNIRPTYQIPGEFGTNVAKAELMAREGMPTQQYNNAVNNIRTNQAGGFLAASRGRGRQSIASMMRVGNNATMGLDGTDADMRMGNERFAFGQRQVLANQRLQKQQWDKFDKYNEIDGKAQGMIGAGRQNTMQALDGITSAAISAIGSGEFGGEGDYSGDLTMGTPYTGPKAGMVGVTGTTAGEFAPASGWNFGRPGQYGTRLNPMASQGRYGTRLNYNR